MSLFFENRDGQTPIDETMARELKLQHIQDMSELYEFERENIALAIAWLSNCTEDIYDLDFWLDVHKRMYSDVWKFAGKIRTVELNNPEFKMPFDVRPSLVELSRDLKAWIEFDSLTDKELSSTLHERLLTIHPFKDGNGRWARVLTEYICRSLKISVPNWGGRIEDDEERRTKYISAVKKARTSGEYNDLIDIMFNH